MRGPQSQTTWALHSRPPPPAAGDEPQMSPERGGDAQEQGWKMGPAARLLSASWAEQGQPQAEGGRGVAVRRERVPTRAFTQRTSPSEQHVCVVTR